MKIKLVLLSFLIMQCHFNSEGDSLNTGDSLTYEYSIIKTESKPEINASWNKSFWRKIKPVRLKNYMGARPSHFPDTKVKLSYDNQNIYVIFRVKDRYVKAVAKDINGRVWEDSCVEFFFTPGPDVSLGYFNLEMNCKGVFLFHWHKNGNQENGPMEDSDNEQIIVSYSLKEDVTEEITKPLVWIVEYCIPFSVLEKYMEIIRPAPGVVWRANLYKCSDKTSHPHWITWAEVKYPEPRFHLPEFFGTLNFK